MNFQINKNKTVDDFKNYIKKFEKPEDDYNPAHAKKLQTPNNYYILDRIRSLYQWVLKNSLLDLRHNYIHNDDEFKQFKGDIENYIRNKIKMEYLNLPDLDWVVEYERKNEVRLSRLRDKKTLLRFWK